MSKLPERKIASAEEFMSVVNQITSALTKKDSDSVEPRKLQKCDFLKRVIKLTNEDKIRWKTCSEVYFYGAVHEDITLTLDEHEDDEYFTGTHEDVNLTITDEDGFHQVLELCEYVEGKELFDAVNNYEDRRIAVNLNLNTLFLDNDTDDPSTADIAYDYINNDTDWLLSRLLSSIPKDSYETMEKIEIDKYYSIIKITLDARYSVHLDRIDGNMYAVRTNVDAELIDTTLKTNRYSEIEAEVLECIRQYQDMMEDEEEAVPFERCGAEVVRPYVHTIRLCDDLGVCLNDSRKPVFIDDLKRPVSDTQAVLRMLNALLGIEHEIQ